MIYIITALKSEAQAFVDKYKLGATKSNENISLSVSGIGKVAMYEATKEIVNIMQKSDTIVNVGICGADKKFNIGDLLPQSIKLTCVDKAVDVDEIYEAVDMESSGFMDATQNVQNRYIFKVVSDHFEPNKVTRDKTKKLIFDKIDEIMETIDA